MRNSCAAETVMELNLKVRCKPSNYINDQTKGDSFFKKLSDLYERFVQKVDKAFIVKKCRWNINNSKHTYCGKPECCSTNGNNQTTKTYLDDYIFCPFCGKEIEAID